MRRPSNAGLTRNVGRAAIGAFCAERKANGTNCDKDIVGVEAFVG